jgi:hypothetical protein
MGNLLHRTLSMTANVRKQQNKITKKTNRQGWFKKILPQFEHACLSSEEPQVQKKKKKTFSDIAYFQKVAHKERSEKALHPRSTDIGNDTASVKVHALQLCQFSEGAEIGDACTPAKVKASQHCECG